MTKKRISPEKVMKELAAIGFARVPDYIDIEGGDIELREGLKPLERAAIASIEKNSTGLKVKFYDKLKALELLGKCGGLFDDPIKPEKKTTNLLQAILASTKEDLRYDDLPEVQQAAAAGNDLVEQTPVETI